MQSQPKQSVTQGHFTQTSFPLCGKHCSTPHSVFFTLSPEGQEHRTHVDRQQADQIPSFQATSHLLQKGIRMQTIWAVSPPSKTTEVILIYMFMDSRQPPFAFQSPQPCSTNPFPQNVLAVWSNQQHPLFTASVRQARPMNVL